jgi:hypothetical protein
LTKQNKNNEQIHYITALTWRKSAGVAIRFAHGGKDGYPFPVDKKTYEHSIDFIKSCLDKAKMGDRDKLDAFKRLSML